MRNILSYQDKVFTGKEIKVWAQDQVNNNKSHKNMAEILLSTTIIDCRKYRLKTRKTAEQELRGCGQHARAIQLERVI